MPTSSDHTDTLGRIADLARQAVAQPDLPEAVRAPLAEILRLAGSPTGDTPESSDIPHTENQSL